MAGKEKVMTENMKSFLEAVSKEEALGKKVNQAKTKEEIIELAEKVGVTLMTADFVNEDGQELSEEELLRAAGGESACIIIGFADDNECICLMAGVGKGRIEESCECILMGYSR